MTATIIAISMIIQNYTINCNSVFSVNIGLLVFTVNAICPSNCQFKCADPKSINSPTRLLRCIICITLLLGYMNSFTGWDLCCIIHWINDLLVTAVCIPLVHIHHTWVHTTGIGPVSAVKTRSSSLVQACGAKLHQAAPAQTVSYNWDRKSQVRKMCPLSEGSLLITDALFDFFFNSFGQHKHKIEKIREVLWNTEWITHALFLLHWSQALCFRWRMPCFSQVFEIRSAILKTCSRTT